MNKKQKSVKLPLDILKTGNFFLNREMHFLFNWNLSFWNKSVDNFIILTETNWSTLLQSLINFRVSKTDLSITCLQFVSCGHAGELACLFILLYWMIYLQKTKQNGKGPVCDPFKVGFVTGEQKEIIIFSWRV